MVLSYAVIDMNSEAHDEVLLDQIRQSLAATRDTLAMEDLPIDEDEKRAVEQFLTTGAIALGERMAVLNKTAESLNLAHDRLEARRGAVDKKLRQLLTLLQGIDPETAERTREEVVSRIYASRVEQPSKARLDLTGMSIREACLAVLQAERRPMLSSELVEALREGGRPIEGDSSSVLSAALSTGMAKEQFVAKKVRNKNVWSLVEWTEEDGEEIELELEG